MLMCHLNTMLLMCLLPLQAESWAEENIAVSADNTHAARLIVFRHKTFSAFLWREAWHTWFWHESDLLIFDSVPFYHSQIILKWILTSVNSFINRQFYNDIYPHGGTSWKENCCSSGFQYNQKLGELTAFFFLVQFSVASTQALL